MNVRIRLPRTLYHQVRSDLERPHTFAAERVGFLFASLGNAGTNEPIVLFTDYSPVPDDRYIDDPYSGARIDGIAIRGAMQEVIDRQRGAFHVHIHAFPGRPAFSYMDRNELPPIVRSLRNVGPHLPHGLFLLSDDDFLGEVWLPGSKESIEAARVSVVGHPLQIHDGEWQ